MKKLIWWKQALNGVSLLYHIFWIFTCTGILNFLYIGIDVLLQARELINPNTDQTGFWALVLFIVSLIVLTLISSAKALEKIFTKKYRIWSM